MATAHPTMKQRIQYVTPAQHQTNNRVLVRRTPADVARPLILLPSYQYYSKRHLIDNYEFEAGILQVNRDIGPQVPRIFGQPPVAGNTRLAGTLPTPASGTRADVKNLALPPEREWTKEDELNNLCTAEQVGKTRVFSDQAVVQKKILNMKANIQATRDIYYLPFWVGGTIYHHEDSNSRQMEAAIARGTFPFIGTPATLAVDKFPATLSLLGMLEKLFTLDPNAPARSPTWMYTAFCTLVEWNCVRENRKTNHAGVLYGGVVQEQDKSSSGFKLIYLETHRREPGCWNKLPLPVMAIGQMLGLTKIYRMFGHQGSTPDCGSYALTTIENIVLRNNRPNLKNQHQIIDLPAVSPSADIGSPGKPLGVGPPSLRFTLPDWLRE